MLDTAALTITPDPYGLLDLRRLRATGTGAKRSDRRAAALLLLGIGDKCRV
ncbi:MAG TPA: hypothetical protein VHU61_16540 [Solirubrobacteraceae bacterium]|nr:hypothetical protein [Solirubrobacteraceae bacterium]